MPRSVCAQTSSNHHHFPLFSAATCTYRRLLKSLQLTTKQQFALYKTMAQPVQWMYHSIPGTPNALTAYDSFTKNTNTMDTLKLTTYAKSTTERKLASSTTPNQEVYFAQRQCIIIPIYSLFPFQSTKTTSHKRFQKPRRARRPFVHLRLEKKVCTVIETTNLADMLHPPKAYLDGLVCLFLGNYLYDTRLTRDAHSHFDVDNDRVQYLFEIQRHQTTRSPIW